jgi:hypothetical protein
MQTAGKLCLFFNSTQELGTEMAISPSALLKLKLSRHTHLIDRYCALRCAALLIHTAPRGAFISAPPPPIYEVTKKSPKTIYYLKKRSSYEN